MKCVREDELLDALGRGFVGAKLNAHVSECGACSELRMIAGALLSERAQAMAEAPVPSAAAMWWRMQVRHRQDVEATARRSLLIGQAMTIAVALFLIVTLLGVDVAIGLREVIAAFRQSTMLLLALAMMLLAVPIAGYVAIRQK